MIEKKKHESECRVPIRKHTSPVDMRISRGRISVGAPTPEVLTAQQAVQKVAAAHLSPVQMTELESVDLSSAAETGMETEGEPEMETEIDAEAQCQSNDNGVPPQLTLRDPPPELNDMPPCPTFKEPPPDDGPYTSTCPAVTHQTCLILWTWRKLADETNAKNAPKIC